MGDRSARAYFVIALLTFGYVATDGVDCGRDTLISDQRACDVVVGATAAVTWPLYWTWTVFDGARRIVGAAAINHRTF